jgi:hypothetical protein
MKIKPHQYQHIANGIERIKLAAINAKIIILIEPTETGSIYSGRLISNIDPFVKIINSIRL